MPSEKQGKADKQATSGEFLPSLDIDMTGESSLTEPAVAERWSAGGLIAFVCCAGLGIGRIGFCQATNNEEVATFHQFYNLPRDKAASGVPVRIRGVVLCYDRGWNQLYVHDGTETAWLSPQNFQTELKQAQAVEVTGSTTFVEGNPAYTNLQIQVLGEGKLPQPHHLGLSQMGKDFGQWVEISGRVRVAETSLGRLGLIIREKQQLCLVYVMGQLTTNDFKWLLGSRVTIRGINASKVAGGRLESASLFAATTNDVVVVEPSKQKPSEMPVIAIDALLNRELGSWTNDMVRLNGLVASYKPGEFMVVKDPTGVIRAKVNQSVRAQVDERVDVWGYLKVSTNETILDDTFFELVPRPAATAATQENQAAGTNQAPVVLERVADVLAIHREEASLGKKVRVRGVMTYADPDWHNGFLQDQSGAIYVDCTQTNIQSGQWVEVRGQTAPGGFAPEIVNTEIEVLGTNNLPQAIKVDLEDLAGGHLDARWVEIQGVVRQVTHEWGHLILRLVTPKGTLRAIVPTLQDKPVPDNLIDALVTVRGACASELNLRRQLNGMTLHVPGLEYVKPEAVPGDPFATRTLPIEEVATFDPDRLAGRRIKVGGVVTLIQPGQWFYLQDLTGGIRVTSPQIGSLHRGDVLEVIGFPLIGDFSPALEEARFRVTGSQALPKPKQTTAEQILLQGTNDGLVVEIEANLLQRVPRSARPKLVLQQGPVIFTAQITAPTAMKELATLAPGSLLRLRGVCAIQGSEQHEPESFRLLLSEADSVRLLRAPPWWTLRHTLMLVGGMTLGILVAWTWIGSLRRQVSAQTEEIRKSHQKLIEVSRQAGMAEVATSVLHNVGNVLNSVNVSSHLIAERLDQSKAATIGQVAALMEAHADELGDFLKNDARGKQLPVYMNHLAEHVAEEQNSIRHEVDCLLRNIGHIRDIIAVQQSYAKVGGVREKVKALDLVEDALRMNQGALERHAINVVRAYTVRKALEITVDKHKVLQILVNLIGNAKYACSESSRPDKRLTLGMSETDGRVKISVTDNGVGIPPENLTRIFNHGFTTRKDGHGFGLHSGAIAAKEMGGTLVARSAGVGQGATFTLELPLNHQPS